MMIPIEQYFAEDNKQIVPELGLFCLHMLIQLEPFGSDNQRVSHNIINSRLNFFSWDFPMPDLRPNTTPSQLKTDQYLPKTGYFSPNFLVLHFGENFMKIQSKMPTCFHSHFYAIFHEFLRWAIKATNML